MEQKKILFITQEVDHFLPGSEIATLSKQMAEKTSANFDIRVFTPKYGLIKDRQKQLHDVIRLSGINIIVNDADHPLIVKVASTPDTRMQVYFVDNEEFFKRQNLFGEDKKHHYGNTERSIFFVRGVLEAIKKLRWVPDIVHCVGWFSALAPLYIKTFYKDDPCFGNVKVVFTTSPLEETAHIDDNSTEVLAFDGISQEQISPLCDDLSAQGLRKVGLQWADGGSLIGTEGDEQIVALATHTSGDCLVSNDINSIMEYHDRLYHQLLG